MDGLMAPGGNYLERKLAGLCTRAGCRRSASEESCLCEKHRRDAVRRSVKAKAKARASRRAQGLCAECGVVKTKRYRCSSCLIRFGRFKQRVPNTEVDKVVRISERTTVGSFAGEEGRARYRGAQGRRGAPGVVREDSVDFADALKYIERGRQGVIHALSPEVKELPLAQRREVMRAALSQADHGARFIDSILERHKYKSRDPRFPNDDEE
jgi:hypothetical protein